MLLSELENLFPPKSGLSNTSLPASTASLPLSLLSLPLIPASVAQAGQALQLTKTVKATPLLTSVETGSGTVASSPQLKLSTFKIASSIAPIPTKLVKKIQALEFIEMRELLPDNIALSERLAALPSALAQSKQPNEREIGGDRALATWVSSFSTYIAIVAEAHPARVRDMLAYLRLVVREASKFGGTGWLTYDAVFRRNHEDPGESWNYLDAALHQVYIASQRDKVVAPCKHCHECDHQASECTVASLLPKPAVPSTEPSSQVADRSSTKGKRPAPYAKQRPVCLSWNAGGCRFPGRCSYAHVCSSCYGSHPASACKDRPTLTSGPAPGAPRQPSTPARADSQAP